MFITYRDLAIAQAQPLDYKIHNAVEVLRQAFAISRYRVGIAFSGGKDSTVLLDLLERYLPDEAQHVAIIYGNTGVEYPECVQFVRQVFAARPGRCYEARPARTETGGFKYAGQRRILERLERDGRLNEVLKADGKLASTARLEALCPDDLRDELERARLAWPAGTVQSYWWCVDQYGWPLLGKARSKLTARRINIDCFLKYSQSASAKPELLRYYELLRRVKISQHCCSVLKKEPSERLQAQLHIDVILKGLMASESRSRQTNFVTRGYLYQSHRPHCDPDPFWHCSPLAIWTEDDVWAYIHKFNVPYARLYDLGFVGRDGQIHKIKRNGCMGCATDLLFPNNHMAMLRRTHPRAWLTFMRAGMAAEIQKLQIAFRRGQMTLMDCYEANELLEVRPCAFDSVTADVPDEVVDGSEPLSWDPEEE